MKDDCEKMVRNKKVSRKDGLSMGYERVWEKGRYIKKVGKIKALRA